MWRWRRSFNASRPTYRVIKIDRLDVDEGGNRPPLEINIKLLNLQLLYFRFFKKLIRNYNSRNFIFEVTKLANLPRSTGPNKQNGCRQIGSYHTCGCVKIGDAIPAALFMFSGVTYVSGQNVDSRRRRPTTKLKHSNHAANRCSHRIIILWL